MSEAYVCAAWESAEAGSVSRVVYERCAAVAPEKAMDGMPSSAASDAAPLDIQDKKSELEGLVQLLWNVHCSRA